MTTRERLLLWWGSIHIGETIRRRALRRALCELVRDGDTILDAGCGRGDNALWCAKQFPSAVVRAVDIDPKLVACVQQRAADIGLENLSVQHADIEHSSFDILYSPFPYAIIYSVDVFEHLHDPAHALERLTRVLQPGGAIILHIPTRTQQRWFRRFEHYEQHDHVREGFTPEEITALMGAAGLTIQSLRHTFGPPGALAWELFHLAQGIGKWCALLTYPVPWALAWVDGWFRWERGNGMLVVARKITP